MFLRTINYAVKILLIVEHYGHCIRHKMVNVIFTGIKHTDKIRRIGF